VSSVVWSPDGTTLATPADDLKIYLWDSTTGIATGSLEKHNSGGLRATYHPAGTLLMSHGWDSQLRMWDPVLRRPWLSLNGWFNLDFSRDGRIVGTADDRLITYQVDPGLEYRTFAHAFSERVHYYRPSIRHDGRVLAVSTDRGVAMWDLARGTEVAFLRIGPIWSVTFEASGDLLTCGPRGVQRWPILVNGAQGQSCIGPMRQLPLPAGLGAISEDLSGRILAVSHFEDAYILTPAGSFRVAPLDDCRSVAVSPNGEWLATGSHVAARGAQVWRVRDVKKMAELPIDSGSGVVFSSDGKWLMTQNPLCRLWEVGTWRAARQIRGRGLCFSPDCRLVVVQEASKVIRLVETETSRTLARLESPDQHSVDSATFSPDGSRLVITTNDSPAVHVWDLRAIRRQLAGMGLDWDAPAYPDDDAARLDLPPLSPLKLDYGSPSGHIEHFSERPEALVERYTARIKQNPNDAEAYHHRAHALFNLNRLAEAIDDLTRAIRLRPGDAHFLHLRGRVYALGLNKWEPAIADLETALAREPSRSETQSFLAECCNNQAWLLATGRPSQQDLDRALTLSLRAVDLAPG
jgi:WD40 repeat protein